MKKTQEIKLMIIENFINNYTSDENERKQMKISASIYVYDDHFDEVGATLESLYHNIDLRCITETDHVTMDTVRQELKKLGAKNSEMDRED